MDFNNVTVLASEGPPYDEEFEMWGVFYGVVPIDGETPVNEAQRLNSKVAEAIQGRFQTFCGLLDLVIRQGSLKPWQELDIALASLAVSLKGAGVNGALDFIRPRIKEAKDPTGGNGFGH